MFYEYHNFLDDELKIIHHIDNLNKNKTVITHLHRNVELLLMREGEAEITIDGEAVVVHSGELAVISPNSIHKISTDKEYCEYYCLIIDHSIYEDWFKAEEMRFPIKTDEPSVIASYKAIFDTLEKKPFCYRQEIKAHIMLMFSGIFRTYNGQTSAELSTADSHRIDMTREAITYMHENFDKDISVEDIAKAVGFSKYYFCRSFKEITGQTPLWHLNYIRVCTAKSLLKSGAANITEAALKCGFNNTSYFCKLYKRYFGKLPKQDCRPNKA